MSNDLVNIYIEPGAFKTKKELMSRLAQMDISFDYNVSKKDYYVGIYDEAVKNVRNRLKIKDRLLKDSRDHDTVNVLRQNRLQQNDYSINEEDSGKKIAKLGSIDHLNIEASKRLLNNPYSRENNRSDYGNTDRNVNYSIT
jgi:hypothetical protein